MGACYNFTSSDSVLDLEFAGFFKLKTIIIQNSIIFLYTDFFS